MYLLKYEHLAVQSPFGKLIHLKAQAEWETWLNILSRNRVMEQLHKRGYEGSLESCASEVYAAAIWGYGVSKWKEGQNDPAVFLAQKFFNGRSFERDPLFTGPGGTPKVFMLLDLWLEQICLDLANDISSLT